MLDFDARIWEEKLFFVRNFASIRTDFGLFQIDFLSKTGKKAKILLILRIFSFAN